MENGNAFTDAMSNEDLEAMREKYPDNGSLITLIDGILASRETEVTQAKKLADFETSLDRFCNGVTKKGKPFLPHPDDVHNIYIRWGEVDIEDTTKNKETVDIVDVPAILDKDGRIEVEAVMHQEERYPTSKQFQWIPEVNHATKTSPGGGDAPKTTKRAVSVFKRDGMALVPKGNYQSASKACDALGLTIGGDSANRVLGREGFIVEAYDGTDFIS